MADADNESIGQLAFERLHQFERGSVVELVGGFVEKQDLRAQHQGAGKAEALLFAAGEMAVPFLFFVEPVFQAAQADLFQGRLNGGIAGTVGMRVADGGAQAVVGQVGALG